MESGDDKSGCNISTGRSDLRDHCDDGVLLTENCFDYQDQVQLTMLSHETLEDKHSMVPGVRRP